MLNNKDVTSHQANARHQYEVQKGRVSRKTSRDKKMYNPPQGEPWIWLTTELLLSEAWRSMSINCYKLIFHLLIEHSNHAGRENGRLLSTYGQLQNYGLTRNKIRAVIEEAEFLGLIKHNEWKSITKEKIKQWRGKTGQLRKNRENYKRNFNTGL